MPNDFPILGIDHYPWLSLAASLVGGLLVAAIVHAIHIGRERRERAASGGLLMAAPGQMKLPTARWLEGDDSPTGRRVLDCRPLAFGVQLVTPDNDLLDKFFEVAHGDPEDVAGQTPEHAWLVAVDWQFDFEETEQILGGMCPQATEDLWRMDVIGNRLYMRRSWTGQLTFMTNFHRVPSDGSRITRLWIPGIEPFSKHSPEYAAAYVRHLLDTHLLNLATPFPIPADFPEDREKIAALVFYSVGRRGWLAEYFDEKENS